VAFKRPRSAPAVTDVTSRIPDVLAMNAHYLIYSVLRRFAVPISPWLDWHCALSQSVLWVPAMRLTSGPTVIRSLSKDLPYGLPDDGCSNDSCPKSLADEIVRLRD
jgi:hypothetical protein